MNYDLNEIALGYVEDVTSGPEDYRVRQIDRRGSGLLLDFGVEAEGGLEAGIALASISMGGLAEVRVQPGRLGDLAWPHVTVMTDFPVASCLFSQYAGWKVNVGKYFAMGSGPMRAVAAKEKLFDKLWYREESSEVVGVLESGELPEKEVFEYIAEACGVAVPDVTLLVAPTSSMAGSVQVVARSVETALHKLYELGFDVTRVRSAFGEAPLAPPAADDLHSIGRTNDAILYGGRVSLWVRGDDPSIEEVLAQASSSASKAYGRLFMELFEEAGRDFYKIDPQLFSPAEILFHNLDTGRIHRTGRISPELVSRSFGLA